VTTLISQRIGSDHERRCDARCYNADGPECDCCCGGMNHGQGLRVALDNTADLCAGQLAYIKAQGFELDPRLSALLDSPQRDLFSPAAEGAR